MRMNNKQRKLLYIREKNDYRKGARGLLFMKVTEEFLSDTENHQTHIVLSLESRLARLRKKFKLNLVFEEEGFKVGQTSEDYLKKLITIKAYFRVKRF